MFDSLRNSIVRAVPGRHTCGLFRRFSRHEEGATAVEFALVAIPFLGLMFAIVEMALVFFAGQALETAVADSARKIMTGQADGWDQAKFKQEVCTRIYGLFDCNKIQINVKAYSSFSGADMKMPIDSNGSITNTFSAGAPGDIVIARLLYEWPVHIPMLKLDDRPGTKRLLVATAAFRNEPYK